MDRTRSQDALSSGSRILALSDAALVAGLTWRVKYESALFWSIEPGPQGTPDPSGAGDDKCRCGRPGDGTIFRVALPTLAAAAERLWGPATENCRGRAMLGSLGYQYGTTSSLIRPLLQPSGVSRVGPSCVTSRKEILALPHELPRLAFVSFGRDWYYALMAVPWQLC